MSNLLQRKFSSPSGRISGNKLTFATSFQYVLNFLTHVLEQYVLTYVKPLLPSVLQTVNKTLRIIIARKISFMPYGKYQEKV